MDVDMKESQVTRDLPKKGDYDPFAHRKVEKPNSDVRSTANLIKASLGSGLLAGPLAFANSGWGVGIVGTIIVGFICGHCIHILVETSRGCCKIEQKPSLGYAETCKSAFTNGPKCLRPLATTASVFAEFALLCTYVGVCCIYTILIADSIKQIVDRYAPSYDIAVEYYCLIFLIPMIILCQIRYLKFLAIFSVVANILLFAVYLICLYYIFGDKIDFTDKIVVGDPARYPAFLSTVIFAMEGIGVVMPVENAMKKPKHFLGCPSVLVVAMGAIVFLYSTLGLFGYFRYGDVLRGSITLNLPIDDCDVSIPGIPATLNYIPLDAPYDPSPKLSPYPSYEGNEVGNCESGLNTVYRVKADKCDRLWVMDTGTYGYDPNVTNVCPYSLNVYDLNTDQRIRRYVFRPEDIVSTTFIANMALDIGSSCDDTFAYFSDELGYGLIAYSWEQNKSWRFSHSYFFPDPLVGDFNIAGLNFQWGAEGIFGISAGPIGLDGYRTLFFSPLSSNTEFAVSTRTLRDETKTKGSYKDFQVLGVRGPDTHTTAKVMDDSGVQLFSLIDQNAIGCWNSALPMKPQNVGLVDKDDVGLVFPSDVKIDDQRNVWVMSDRMPVFLESELDYSDINFRIYTAPLQTLLQGTVCEPQQQFIQSLSPSSFRKNIPQTLVLSDQAFGNLVTPGPLPAAPALYNPTSIYTPSPPLYASSPKPDVIGAYRQQLYKSSLPKAQTYTSLTIPRQSAIPYIPNRAQKSKTSTRNWWPKANYEIYE